MGEREGRSRAEDFRGGRPSAEGSGVLQFSVSGARGQALRRGLVLSSLLTAPGGLCRVLSWKLSPRQVSRAVLSSAVATNSRDCIHLKRA